MMNAKKIFLGLFISSSSVQCELIIGLLADTRQAYFSRNYKLVSKLAGRLENLPAASDIGRWYSILADRNDRDIKELERLADSGNPVARCCALSTLANERLRNGLADDETIKMVLQANKIAQQNNDLLNYFQTRRQLCLAASIKGDHKTSLSILRDLQPFIRGSSQAALVPDYYNSVAFELLQTGDINRAARYISCPLNSPYLTVYPEWMETAKEISLKLQLNSRARIYPGCDLLPGNVEAINRRPRREIINEERQNFSIRLVDGDRRVMLASIELPDDDSALEIQANYYLGLERLAADAGEDTLLIESGFDGCDMTDSTHIAANCYDRLESLIAESRRVKGGHRTIPPPETRESVGRIMGWLMPMLEQNSK